MAKVDKILKKMRQNLHDWQINQFEIVAKNLGIKVRKPRGSHVIFEHEDWYESLSVPAHRPIKPIYVKKFLALIDQISNLGGDKNG